MKILMIMIWMWFGRAEAFGQWDDKDADELSAHDLEDLTAQTDAESEDDFDAQQLSFYKMHPLNLNDEASRLSEFPLLDPLHLASLLAYRKALGDFISIYELQAVPGFNPDLVRSMVPYITVEVKGFSITTVRQRLENGEESMLMRSSVTPERAKGFSVDSAGNKKYLGARRGLFMRYKYQYKDLLQYGILADEDAGEQVKFNAQQWGFDFYSWHIFARKLGCLKAIALGDYTVNLGQGLIQWQSLAFTKSADVIAIKRQSEILRPYQSAGEYNFYRGAAATFQKNKWQGTLFYSLRNISANRDRDSSGTDVITSIQTSGLHRSASEIEDRNSIRMKSIGGNLQWGNQSGHIGINGVHYTYSMPLLKRDEPYNLYAIRGDAWNNFSADFSYSIHNYHLFGEVALDKKGSCATVIGLMASLSRRVDLALLVRSIPPSYQSIFGHAFTENTMPSNEDGVYIGLHAQPSTSLTIDYFADVFRFPWLRYRADAPGYGAENMLQLRWVPGRKVDVSTRWRTKLKPANEAADDHHAIVVDRRLRSWRNEVSFQVSRHCKLSSRMEFSWYDKPGDQFPETGFLVYIDIQYHSAKLPLTIGGRIQHFETGSYNTRLYAYESDVLFASTIPAFFGDGSRLYLNAKYHLEISPKTRSALNINVKAGRTIYTGQNSVGSGLDEIPGRHKTDIRLQLFFQRK